MTKGKIILGLKHPCECYGLRFYIWKVNNHLYSEI